MTSTPLPPEPNQEQRMRGRFEAETNILGLISACLPKEKLKILIKEIENLSSSNTPEASEEFHQGQKEIYKDFLRLFRQINS